MIAFDVYLRRKLIDTVFYSAGATVDADEVKRSLVGHDGYNPAIVVRRRRTPDPCKLNADASFAREFAKRIGDTR